MTAGPDDLRQRFAAVSGSIGDSGPQQGPLKGGGGGDNLGGDMEARIARLEAQYEHVTKGLDKIEASVGDLKIGQATLLERSQHAASQLFIAIAVGAGVGFIAALIGIMRALQP